MKFSNFSPSSLTILALLAGHITAQLNSTIVSSSARDDTSTLASITQLLSLFGFVIDTKDFAALANVFAPDAQRTGGGGVYSSTILFPISCNQTIFLAPYSLGHGMPF